MDKKFQRHQEGLGYDSLKYNVVLTNSLDHSALWPSELVNYILCKRVEVQALLRSLLKIKKSSLKQVKEVTVMFCKWISLVLSLTLYQV